MTRKKRFAYDGRPLPDIINLHLKGDRCLAIKRSRGT